MELLIVGTLNGQIGAASKIAISKGGQVSLADGIDSALDILRSGKNVELVMIDVTLDVHKFINSLEIDNEKEYNYINTYCFEVRKWESQLISRRYFLVEML